MTYYKDSYHEELYLDFMGRLKTRDQDYSAFAYVASAIGKKEIATALEANSIDYEALWKMSSVWSNAEKAMLEVAWQVFSGGNFFEDDEENWSFPSIGSIFKSLDTGNSKVVIEAITKKFI